jgi:hypothetical protein
LEDISAQCFVMKMLLASSDLLSLQPVAKRLLASGIPIALCKASQLSPCLEVWIQRDSDFSQARRLLVGGLVPAAVAPVPAKALSPAMLQRPKVSKKSMSFVTSKVGFCVWWRRELRQG